MAAPAQRTTRRRPAGRRRSRLWIVGIAGACLIAFLYYRPVKAYISTSHQLSARRAEVKQLSHQKAVLEQRLTRSTTGQNLLEEARRLGYVRPGEHLLIVHGVKEWLKAHAQPGG